MNTYSYDVLDTPEIPPLAPQEICEAVCDLEAANEARVTLLRPSNLSNKDAVRLAETFAALSDPTRLRLLEALERAGEMCVCDLCALLDLRQSNVSHQLRLLRSLHLVRNRRVGKNVFYALDDEHVRSLLRQGLDHIREDRPSSEGASIRQ